MCRGLNKRFARRSGRSYIIKGAVGNCADADGSGVFAQNCRSSWAYVLVEAVSTGEDSLDQLIDRALISSSQCGVTICCNRLASIAPSLHSPCSFPLQRSARSWTNWTVNIHPVRKLSFQHCTIRNQRWIEASRRFLISVAWLG